MRHARVSLLLLLACALPARAQVAIGDTGWTISGTGTLASDYVSRGISQTMGRMAYQASGELAHESGVYIGGFIGNVRFAGTDAREEIDLLAGFRFTWGETNFDIGGIGTFYPSYSAGRASDAVDYGEAYLRVNRGFGPVKLMASVNVSPNFFDATGLGVYVEGGADWETGLWHLTLSARLGYQFIEKNKRYGTPDYTWWGLGVSRDFEIAGVGTVTASVTYFDTTIPRNQCLSGQGVQQDVCTARVIAGLAFRF